jgi:hypothetical protein
MINITKFLKLLGKLKVVYAIKGETNDIILLAYKINKSINNNTIKAQTQELLIQGDSSALKVQIFGVNND